MSTRRICRVSLQCHSLGRLPVINLAGPELGEEHRETVCDFCGPLCLYTFKKQPNVVPLAFGFVGQDRVSTDMQAMIYVVRPLARCVWVGLNVIARDPRPRVL